MHSDVVAAVLQQLWVWLQLQHLSLSVPAITGPVSHIRISIYVLSYIFFTHLEHRCDHKLKQKPLQPCLINKKQSNEASWTSSIFRIFITAFFVLLLIK